MGEGRNRKMCLFGTEAMEKNDLRRRAKTRDGRIRGGLARSLLEVVLAALGAATLAQREAVGGAIGHGDPGLASGVAAGLRKRIIRLLSRLLIELVALQIGLRVFGGKSGVCSSNGWVDAALLLTEERLGIRRGPAHLVTRIVARRNACSRCVTKMVAWQNLRSDGFCRLARWAGAF